MVSDAADGPDEQANGPGDRTDAAGGADSPIVDRWLTLDRGWQALALGLAVVGAHLAGRAAGLF